jgi:hypothetical protein
MKLFQAAMIFAVGAAGLCGCHVAPFADQGKSAHGRYVGVGIYGPSRQWARMAAIAVPKDEASAGPIDDQAIIVVSDTDTGEVRACGDLTGYCIGFNPWKQPLANGQQSPVALTAHVQPDDPSLTVEVGPAPRRKHPPRAPADPVTNQAAAARDNNSARQLSARLARAITSN